MKKLLPFVASVSFVIGVAMLIYDVDFIRRYDVDFNDVAGADGPWVID